MLFNNQFPGLVVENCVIVQEVYVSNHAKALGLVIKKCRVIEGHFATSYWATSNLTTNKNVPPTPIR